MYINIYKDIYICIYTITYILSSLCSPNFSAKHCLLWNICVQNLNSYAVFQTHLIWFLLWLPSVKQQQKWFFPQQNEKDMHNINKDLLKNVKRSTANTFGINLKGGMILSKFPYKKAFTVYQHLIWIIQLKINWCIIYVKWST